MAIAFDAVGVAFDSGSFTFNGEEVAAGAADPNPDFLVLDRTSLLVLNRDSMLTLPRRSVIELER